MAPLLSNSDNSIFDRFLSISDNFLPMTGEQLKNVRTGKGMARAAFATWLWRDYGIDAQ